MTIGDELEAAFKKMTDAVERIEKIYEEKEEPKPARWFPSPDDEYFFVNTMLTVSFLKFNPEHHDCVARRDAGNCFETEYEAKVLAIRLRNATQAYNREIEAGNKGKKADSNTISCHPATCMKDKEYAEKCNYCG